jgi:hypothetical protein
MVLMVLRKSILSSPRFADGFPSHLVDSLSEVGADRLHYQEGQIIGWTREMVTVGGGGRIAGPARRRKKDWGFLRRSRTQVDWTRITASECSGKKEARRFFYGVVRRM